MSAPDKECVRAFFDRCAKNWDAEMVRNERIISGILDRAGVAAGKSVLDVACGTGVLIPDYLERKVGRITAIDLSPEMIRLAREKFRDKPVRFLTGDAEAEDFGESYDVIMVYNAFPHFSDPEGLITHLSGFLAPGGHLSIAHGMSRERINAHHSGTARPVSAGLMEAEALAALMGRFLKVETVLSDEKQYQVVGRK